MVGRRVRDRQSSRRPPWRLTSSLLEPPLLEIGRASGGRALAPARHWSGDIAGWRRSPVRSCAAPAGARGVTRGALSEAIAAVLVVATGMVARVLPLIRRVIAQ